MKAARRRKSGIGDDENGWKRSSSVRFTVDFGAELPVAVASGFTATFEPNETLAGAVRLSSCGCDVCKFLADVAVHAATVRLGANCFRSEAEHRPHAL